MSDDKKQNSKKDYDFGGVKEFSLEQIEKEILNESVYLDVFAGSDVRFKHQIEDVTNALTLIHGLKAKKYNYNTEKYPNKRFSKAKQIGFLAGDVKNAIPEAVKADGEGMEYVNYSAIVPVLVESVKELSETVEKQQKQIEELLKKIK